MSSNFTVQRICDFCGEEFTARTTVTRHCSDKCSKRTYKKRQLEKKIDKSNHETFMVKQQPYLDVMAKEFLTVKDLSMVLGCSKSTAHRLIKKGIVHSVNLSERLTRIRKQDIEFMFEPLPVNEKEFTLKDCYQLKEVQDKYNIGERGLNKIIKKHKIPKLKKGIESYIPKKLIDAILS